MRLFRRDHAFICCSCYCFSGAVHAVVPTKGAKTVEPLRAPRATVEWVCGKQPGESAVSAMVLERHWLKYVYIAKEFEFELYEVRRIGSWKTKASPGIKEGWAFQIVQSSFLELLLCFVILCIVFSNQIQLELGQSM